MSVVQTGSPCALRQQLQQSHQGLISIGWLQKEKAMRGVAIPFPLLGEKPQPMVVANMIFHMCHVFYDFCLLFYFSSLTSKPEKFNFLYSS